MIGELISDLFKTIGHTWKTDQGFTQPTEEDVNKVLDNAAGSLYHEQGEPQYEQGGIIVQKTDIGLDVFAYVGTYY